jgi:Circadian oscillating protein COP23
MKSFFLPTLFLSTALAIAALPTIALSQSVAENNAGTVRFACSTATDPSSRKELPATVANVDGNTESTVIIVWKSEYFGTKYTPQQRCAIVSASLQKAFQEGRTYIGSGVEKSTGLGIVCGVANPDQSCDRTNMLLTLKSYQTADETVETLGQILQGKTGKPIYQSSGGKRVDLRDLLIKRRVKLIDN